MANSLFVKGREGFLTGQIDWDTGTIKAALVKGYTLDVTDTYVSEITGAGGTLVGSTAVTGKTATDGVAGSSTIDFGVVSTDATVHTGIVFFQSSAPSGGSDLANNAQRLIGWVDTLAGGVAMAVYPNGTQITFTPDSTSGNKLFKL